MQKRCDRNRKRSQRRKIYCPEHHCYLDSVSPKYPLYADQIGQLQSRGMNHKNAAMLITARTSVPLTNEWLEAFWCQECQETNWFYVVKKGQQLYAATPATRELWQKVTGLSDPSRNPSISEFTQRHSAGVSR
ncbi:MAG: hypothetical protein HC835_11330 [Oscillatoriales cyanobacterium RM2_1_1]|nr:hypothetical protein [Oscillatoriales cyanobacterium SM2_3_0]NJO46167.1 hypothetical protein [Oscillatoriales cyanobacterium RM2_1_1]